ncbi:MAG: HTH domain-containing protein [Methylococcaceae bacterium]
MITIISTRQRQILEQLLLNKNGLSVAALAHALSISRTAIQQHFILLESEAYIRKHTQEKTAGRPVTLYAITDKGINYFPKQYAWFSDLLLSQLQQELGSERFQAYMRKIGQQLASNLQANFFNKNEAEKIKELLSIMNNLGFVVNQTNQIDIIQAHNCIYHDLAKQYVEICQFDLALMSSLLNKEVEQLSCMAKGDCSCRFKINSIKINAN